MSFYFELVLRILFGLQMVFSGLNGFFHWMAIPPSGPVITKFVEACYETKFIMPVVKLMEIFFGLFLIIGFMTPASLLILAPVIFVITGLHLFHNPKPWMVLGTCSAPYLILLTLHSGTWLRLIH